MAPGGPLARRCLCRLPSIYRLQTSSLSYDSEQLERAVSRDSPSIATALSERWRRSLLWGRLNMVPEKAVDVTPEVGVVNSGPREKLKMPVFALSSMVIAEKVARYYRSLDEDSGCDQRYRLFLFLAEYLGPDHETIKSTVKRMDNLYDQDREAKSITKSLQQLRPALQPLYSDLFGLIAQQKDGLKTIVDMRGDLVSILRGDQVGNGNGVAPPIVLQVLDSHLKELVSQWFTLGFLDLQQITWETPCDIMEKVSQYEAVHSVRSWRDMKHRVGPQRRVYIFTHWSMPREPVVILHTALTEDPTSNVQELLDRTKPAVDPGSIKTAVFYSISAAHKGLSGVELGYSLIKQVVHQLQVEFPHLEEFVTLSPVTGFRAWLDTHLRHHTQEVSDKWKLSLSNLMEVYPDYVSPQHALQQALADIHTWATPPHSKMAATLQHPLMTLCARYLVNEKRRGFALNSVAHFHIRNGASLWRLNWLGNVSPHGMRQSYGIMANYRYNLPDMETNSQNYILRGQIGWSDQVQEHLSPP